MTTEKRGRKLTLFRDDEIMLLSWAWSCSAQPPWIQRPQRKSLDLLEQLHQASRCILYWPCDFNTIPKSLQTESFQIGGKCHFPLSKLVREDIWKRQRIKEREVLRPVVKWLPILFVSSNVTPPSDELLHFHSVPTRPDQNMILTHCLP